MTVLVSRAVLWLGKSLRPRSSFTELNTDAYDQITSFAPRIKHLTLNFAGGLNDEGLDVLGKKLKHLVRIELYGPYLVRVCVCYRSGLIHHLTGLPCGIVLNGINSSTPFWTTAVNL